MLAVEDTGHGMDEATQARVFEPFFTTKPPGHGTGLGLATVHGITLQAGGRVGVSSVPGGGARFAVCLPAETGVPVPVSEPPQAGGRGTETILLVEDDAAVRAVSARALAAHGYRVVEAPDGRQALRIADEQSAIALVITDVVMPVMDGWELARALEDRHPRLPVLMVSGYAPRPQAGQGLRRSPALLTKPFTPEQLAARVREMLDGARTRTADAAMATRS
jgi:CheY-like chemotaxis protein